MSKSKKRKAQRELAIKKYKRGKILTILTGVVVIAGIITACIFLTDWNNAGNTHVHGDSCAHP